jgi:hypothetical protein
MKIKIKKFDVEMEIKNKGIEMDVYTPAGVRLGDVIVTKTKIIWCEGKTGRKNGREATWEQFIEWMNSD